LEENEEAEKAQLDIVVIENRSSRPRLMLVVEIDSDPFYILPDTLGRLSVSVHTL